MPQFNGKQEAMPLTAEANLRCPRNGKRTNSSQRDSAPSTKPLDAPETARLGRRWKYDPPARIPANTVVASRFGRSRCAHISAGKPGRAFNCSSHRHEIFRVTPAPHGARVRARRASGVRVGAVRAAADRRHRQPFRRARAVAAVRRERRHRRRDPRIRRLHHQRSADARAGRRRTAGLLSAAANTTSTCAASAAPPTTTRSSSSTACE